VVAVVPRIGPYADFCRRHVSACRLDGAGQIRWEASTVQAVQAINSAVNGEIRFAHDRESYGAEDYWALPLDGAGDCEDMALEKRSRLVAAGFPGAALRLALVFHPNELASHCVLTAETTKGTFILDSRDNAMRRWDRSGYLFEARERADGLWDRFDQSDWWSAR
jgi:predicted transglutaminase-like cysteine proteinase